MPQRRRDTATRGGLDSSLRIRDESVDEHRDRAYRYVCGWRGDRHSIGTRLHATVSVDVGDLFYALADNAGGAEGSVGTSWSVLEHNLTGVQSALTLTDNGTSIVIAIPIGANTVYVQAGTGSIGANTTGTVSYPQSYGTVGFGIANGGPSNTTKSGDVHGYSFGTTGISICNSSDQTCTYNWISVGY